MQGKSPLNSACTAMRQSASKLMQLSSHLSVFGDGWALLLAHSSVRTIAQQISDGRLAWSATEPAQGGECFTARSIVSSAVRYFAPEFHCTLTNNIDQNVTSAKIVVAQCSGLLNGARSDATNARAVADIQRCTTR
jgi:hypothetical protein